MESSTKDESLESARRYIDSIDFSKIIDKMVRLEGWKIRNVEKLCVMYRHYLYLKRKYGDEYLLPPSEEIDIFWHNHILDTKQYREDCQTIFGKYLDHYPYLGLDGKTDFSDAAEAFELTKQLYFKEFGASLEVVVPKGFKGKIINFLTWLDDNIAKLTVRTNVKNVRQ